MFGKKKDGGSRLGVDYWALNSTTMKNRYPFPVISEMLDRLRGARNFTKLDLRNAFHLIRIKDADEYQTTSQTWYGQFGCQVIPLGLINAPATFQSYIDHYLRTYIDDFATCYIDDILIYTNNEKEHSHHI